MTLRLKKVRVDKCKRAWWTDACCWQVKLRNALQCCISRSGMIDIWLRLTFNHEDIRVRWMQCAFWPQCKKGYRMNRRHIYSPFTLKWRRWRRCENGSDEQKLHYTGGDEGMQLGHPWWQLNMHIRTLNSPYFCTREVGHAEVTRLQWSTLWLTNFVQDEEVGE